MLFRHALGETIRELRHEQGLTLRQVSKMSCVALGYLSEVERGHKEASSEIVAGIANSLNVSTARLVIMAGYRIGGLDLVPNTAQELLDTASDLVSR